MNYKQLIVMYIHDFNNLKLIFPDISHKLYLDIIEKSCLGNLSEDDINSVVSTIFRERSCDLFTGKNFESEKNYLKIDKYIYEFNEYIVRNEIKRLKNLINKFKLFYVFPTEFYCDIEEYTNDYKTIVIKNGRILADEI